MLTSKHRFHGYGSLRRVYQRSKGARGQMVGLRYAQRKPGQPYRVAVVVARKVHKSAVKRNRIRRRTYEVVRLSSKVPLSTDLIFTAYSDKLADIPIGELETQIDELLKKASLSALDASASKHR
jgi:ribonuclease P protein component